MKYYNLKDDVIEKYNVTFDPGSAPLEKKQKMK